MSTARKFVANRAGGLQQVRVNITANVDNSKIKREKRNNRDVIVVPSATLPDNVVMNGILYPPEEIERSFKSLERTLAPLGHPVINGAFVPAADPEALASHFIGAWNENVRRENGRVFIDKVIDVAVANASEGGQRVLKAIEDGDPIHTSTGLLTELEPVTGADHKFVARNMAFDHDAILLDEPGAAQPHQGVGMLVNGQSVEVINSVFSDEADKEMGWGLEQVFRAAEKKQRAGLMERVQQAVLSALESAGLYDKPAVANNQETAMNQEKFDALAKKVDDLAAAVTPEALSASITTAVNAALKPVLDAAQESAEAQKAKDEAERTELVNKLVAAKVVSEDAGKELTLNAARELGKLVAPGKAFALNAGTTDGDRQSGFTAPKGD